MRQVSIPSPFHIRSVRMVCVHTVRRVHSPSRTAHDRGGLRLFPSNMPRNAFFVIC